jgi:excinuclease UvrABC nuclease subunit
MTADLYRFFDINGRLLYVGISRRFFNRLQNHQKGPFFASVTRIEIERFADREDAKIAEHLAIVRERPFYNRTKLTRPKLEKLVEACK